MKNLYLFNKLRDILQKRIPEKGGIETIKYTIINSEIISILFLDYKIFLIIEKDFLNIFTIPENESEFKNCDIV